MFNSFKKILVLSPHTDDGELGAGGTIAQFIRNGASVYYAAFSTAEESVPPGFPRDILTTEVTNATKVLGIKKENLLIYKYQVRRLNYSRQEILEDLIKIRSLHNFDLVLMPSPNDIHQDHQVITQEGLRAFKKCTILGYELIWNNLSFNTTAFMKLDQAAVDLKVKALSAYESQSGRDYMSPDFIRSLAKARGVQIGHEYAEAFEVLRFVMG